MLSPLKSLFLPLLLTGLLVTNVLTLTSMAFNTAVSGLLATTLGVKTVSSALQQKLASQDVKLKKHDATIAKRKQATRKFGQRLTQRTKRVAAKSIAAIPAESIPFIGIGVLIADTSYELYAACETIRDLDQLYADLGMPDQSPEDAIRTACNPDLPSAEEVWADVLRQSEAWWQSVADAL